MALNKFMHPRNKYFNNPPNFAELCEKYPEFKDHTTATSPTKVILDFKDPEALRSLTCTLLKEDFDLDVHLPIDRIIPTVPLRLNYILWIEDLLANSDVKPEEQIIGIDIGCGSSCIYPLLGFQLNKWKFIASEVDSLSLQYAKENVQANDAEKYIKVYEAAENTMILEIVADNPQPLYHFTMCNPPFFGNMLEAQGILSRSMDRAEPKSVSTASEGECIADGGEVEFIKRMIQDSLKLRHKILWFTSMVGKKSSLPLIKQELHKHKISHFTTTEFCQGRTMRWGIAWTFHEEVEVLPPAKRFKPSKEKPPLTISVPPKFIEKVLRTHPKAKGQLNMIKFFCKEVKKCLRNLEITFSKSHNSTALQQYQLIATKNTWSKQRQKRREQERLRGEKGTDGVGNSDQRSETTNTAGESHQRKGNTETLGSSIERLQSEKVTFGAENGDQRSETTNTAGESQQNTGIIGTLGSSTEILQSEKSTDGAGNGDSISEATITAEKSHQNRGTMGELGSSTERLRPKDDTIVRDDQMAEATNTEGTKSIEIAGTSNQRTDTIKCKSNINTGQTPNTDTLTQASSINGLATNFLFKCFLGIKMEDGNVVMEMTWIDGKNRELMHQLGQYFKNFFKREISAYIQEKLL